MLTKKSIEKIESRVATAGVVASPDDDRDWTYVPTLVPTLRNIDQSQYYGIIQDQGTVGICTGETATSMCESIKNQFVLYQPGISELSRRFNYFYSRQYDNLQGDSGATPRSMCRSAKNYGLPLESSWPFNTNIDQVPTEAVKAEALQSRLTDYEVLPIDRDNWRNTLYALRSAMQSGRRACIAFQCKRWMFYVNGPLGSAGHKQGAMANEDPMNEIIGGHITPIDRVDLDLMPESGGAIVSRGSWGLSYGDNGRWSIPAIMLGDTAFLMEIRLFRSFAGYEVAPATEIPLTVAEIRAAKQKLANLGIASYDSATDSFSTVPIPDVHYFAILKSLNNSGYNPSECDTILGTPSGTVQSFIDANTARVQAWVNM